MDSSCRIRDAESSDSGEIARLCIELGYPAAHDEIATRMLALQPTANNYIAVAAGQESTLLGWVAAEHRLLLESGERVEIVGLVVDRTARRKGIGKMLVAAVEAWTAARGLSTVFVRSNTARVDSHHFYPGMGYERKKTQHAYTKSVKAR